MDDTRNPLQATMLEAEAVWGTGLKDLIDHVFKLEREFVVYVQIYLHALNSEISIQGSFVRHEHLLERRNVLYHLDSPDDVYWAEMTQALQDVEGYLRERLIQA